MIATVVTITWSVCPSFTLVHPPKAVGRNEMLFGNDIGVVPSNVVSDRGQTVKVAELLL